MGVMRYVDSFMDWALDKPSYIGFPAVFGAVSAVIGVIASPFIYLAIHNAEELERTFEDLDNRPSIVFQDVAECTSEGYTLEECEASEQIAASISKSLGTTLKYSSLADCSENHMICEKRTSRVPITNRVGNVTTTTYVNQTNYLPPVTAWQAATDDLSVSVPLYIGSDQDEAIRKDGTSFDLEQ